MNRNDRHHAADPAKAHPHSTRTQPVRLPQATADLVNRMLAARCGNGGR